MVVVLVVVVVVVVVVLVVILILGVCILLRVGDHGESVFRLRNFNIVRFLLFI
jgi:hypothetical protein